MSFDASPSSNRPSKIGALRLLLTLGADASRLDDQGYTAESRALKEQRWAAVKCFKRHWNSLSGIGTIATARLIAQHRAL